MCGNENNVDWRMLWMEHNIPQLRDLFTHLLLGHYLVVRQICLTTQNMIFSVTYCSELHIPITFYY